MVAKRRRKSLKTKLSEDKVNQVQNENILTFATAHPAKFPEVFNDVEGFEENVPLELKNIFEKQQKFVKLNDKYEDIADFISSNYAS